MEKLLSRTFVQTRLFHVKRSDSLTRLVLCNRKPFVTSQSLPNARLASTVVLGNINPSVKSLDEAKPFSALPGPKTYPVIGSLPAFFREGGDISQFHKKVINLRKKYGDVFRFSILGLNCVAIGDPAIVEEIFRHEGKYPSRDPPLPAWLDYHKKRGISEGIFVLTGEEWWHHRSALNPKMMKPKQVELYGPAINEVTDDFITTIIAKADSDGVVSGIEKFLSRWALESACTATLERRLGCFDKEPNPKYLNYIEAAESAFEALLKLANEITPLARIFGTKARRQMTSALDVLYGTGTELVMEKLQEFKQKEIDNALDDESLGEFIPYLYHEKKMDIADIVSDINSLLFAAVETTSTTVLWALYYLAHNKDKQTALRAEVKENISTNNFVSAKNLQALHYLRGVEKETLRCAGVVGMNSRIYEDEVIINGCRTPKKTMFILLHEGMSKDPKYVENPDRFSPERWLRGPDRKDLENHHPFLHLPFGFGRRMCLGRRLAELEMQIVLAKIINQYEVDCLQENVDSVMTGVIKPDRPLQFRFRRI